LKICQEIFPLFEKIFLLFSFQPVLKHEKCLLTLEKKREISTGAKIFFNLLFSSTSEIRTHQSRRVERRAYSAVRNGVKLPPAPSSGVKPLLHHERHGAAA
jgi:hypothetical protein